MRTHAYAHRVNVKSGEVTRVEFIEKHGKILNAAWRGGFDRQIALHIVNHWNYLITKELDRKFYFYLPNVSGTD